MKDFKIQIPEGYIIDTEYSDIAEGIIKFKKVHSILNWEDFINKEPLNGYIRMEQFYNKYGEGKSEFHSMCFTSDTLKDYSTYKSPIFANIEEAKSIIALIKLLLIRNLYIGNWNPNWEDEDEPKYVIDCLSKSFTIVKYYLNKRLLSFPNKEMAELFIKNNKELLEEYFNF